MARNLFYILILILLGSCENSSDEPQNCAAKNEEIKIQLTLLNSEARSYVSNDGTINEFRIFVFNQNPAGGFIFEKQYTYLDFSPSSTTPCIISVKPGVKKFYCFANADKATLSRFSTGNSFVFNQNTIYTESDINDILIKSFVYTSPQYDYTDLIPMTGFLQGLVTNATNQSAQIFMTRVIAKVILQVKLKNALPAGETLSIKYASIGNNPVATYLFPQYDSQNRVKVPNTTADSYTNAVSYIPATPIAINSTANTIMTAYIMENPYGKGANSGIGNTTLPDHTSAEGYSGYANRLNLFYIYETAGGRIEKGILENIPYVERNNTLIITAIITPSSNTTENFTINVNVAPWITKIEDVPVYQ